MTRKETLIRRLRKVYAPDEKLIQTLSRQSTSALESFFKAWAHHRRVWRATLTRKGTAS